MNFLILLIAVAINTPASENPDTVRAATERLPKFSGIASQDHMSAISCECKQTGKDKNRIKCEFDQISLGFAEAEDPGYVKFKHVLSTLDTAKIREIRNEFCNDIKSTIEYYSKKSSGAYDNEVSMALDKLCSSQKPQPETILRLIEIEHNIDMETCKITKSHFSREFMRVGKYSWLSRSTSNPCNVQSTTSLESKDGLLWNYVYTILSVGKGDSLLCKEFKLRANIPEKFSHEYMGIINLKDCKYLKMGY